MRNKSIYQLYIYFSFGIMANLNEPQAPRGVQSHDLNEGDSYY